VRIGAILHQDSGPVVLVVQVVSEQIVLLRVDDGLDDLSGLVTLRMQDTRDNVHDLALHTREAVEDTRNDRTGNTVQRDIGVLNQLKGWVSQLLELRVDQVDEDVD
jgi:hypothetical protein